MFGRCVFQLFNVLRQGTQQVLQHGRELHYGYGTLSHKLYYQQLTSGYQKFNLQATESKLNCVPARQLSQLTKNSILLSNTNCIQSIKPLFGEGEIGTEMYRSGVWGHMSVRTNIRCHFPRPSERKRVKTHGFKTRMATPAGRRILMRRILKGRHVLSH